MLLEIKELSVSFESIYGKSHVLDHVSINIKKGEIIGVVGESGSGKSVTALAIIRLLHKNASIDSGEILYENENLLTKDEKEIQAIRGKKIGMVFQEPMTALNPTMKIGKQLANVIRKHREVSKKEAHELAIETLKDVKIKDAEKVSEKYPFQLSGGMRQRVVIALAMAAPPDLLIADEPTTALDVTVQNEILKLMKSLSEKKGTSILFITHDLAVVGNFCDRVYVMYQGKIVESGKTADVLHKPEHPYTRALIESLPEGKNPDEPLKVIDGEPFVLNSRPTGCVFIARCPLKTEQCSNVPPVRWRGTDHWAACWEVEENAGNPLARKEI
ncbi:MAG: ABC transporter ATP-binding protein [Bacillaceae bacterium]|nr:ABC transporter ATP-binding protein [Bacillaceae bacterium]